MQGRNGDYFLHQKIPEELNRQQTSTKGIPSSHYTDVRLGIHCGCRS